MTPEELDLDTVRNKVLYPVFQATLKTPETAAVVLDMAKEVEKSRKIWEAVQEYFRTSVYHQNTKSSLKTGISNHRWANMQWTGTFAQFVLDLERKINVDAIIEDFNRQATRRSHMDRHSADHQDPPAGDGGGNPSSGGANRMVRRASPN